MVRSRVYGILAGYEDQIDHDTLRADPVFKLLAERSPEDQDLASQPTLSRFENAISIKSLKRLRDVFIGQFIASFDVPPRHLTFDLDAVDDPARGQPVIEAGRRDVASRGGLIVSEVPCEAMPGSRAEGAAAEAEVGQAVSEALTRLEPRRVSSSSHPARHVSAASPDR
jgi:hypothetical protein